MAGQHVLPGAKQLRLHRHPARLRPCRPDRQRPGRRPAPLQRGVRAGVRARVLRGVRARPPARLGPGRRGRGGGGVRVRAVAPRPGRPPAGALDRWDRAGAGHARPRPRLVAAARLPSRFSFPNISQTGVKKIKEKPEEVRKITKALIRANRFIRENREGTIQILADWGRTGREYAAASYDSSWGVFNLNGSIPEQGLRLVLDQAKKDAKISREIPLAEVSDLTILQDVQKELGVAQRHLRLQNQTELAVWNKTFSGKLT